MVEEKTLRTVRDEITTWLIAGGKVAAEYFPIAILGGMIGAKAALRLLKEENKI